MSIICTLYEGDYHLGLGALVNSLLAKGFRGRCYVGYRGSLPPWAKSSRQENGVSIFQVNKACSLHFLPLATTLHLNNHKAEFILDLMQRHCPKEDVFFFFDPDIILKARWDFMEEWVARGIALCEDVNDYLPCHHPVREAWKEYAAEHGWPVQQELDRFYNGGFFGVRREHKSFLEIWKQLFHCRAKDGADLTQFAIPGSGYPYLHLDQDLMNAALMLVPHPITAIGPEGMDFRPGGCVMSHAAGTIKTWRKQFVWEALKGLAPTTTDKEFLQHTQFPIKIYSDARLNMNRLGLKIAAAIGRFYQRQRF